MAHWYGKPLTGYPGLACALLNRAVRDAKLTGWRRAEAVLFLSSAGCGELIVNLGDAMDVPIGKSAQRALLHELGVGHNPESLGAKRAKGARTCKMT